MPRSFRLQAEVRQGARSGAAAKAHNKLAPTRFRDRLTDCSEDTPSRDPFCTFTLAACSAAACSLPPGPVERRRLPFFARRAPSVTAARLAGGCRWSPTDRVPSTSRLLALAAFTPPMWPPATGRLASDATLCHVTAGHSRCAGLVCQTSAAPGTGRHLIRECVFIC